MKRFFPSASWEKKHQASKRRKKDAKVLISPSLISINEDALYVRFASYIHYSLIKLPSSIIQALYDEKFSGIL